MWKTNQEFEVNIAALIRELEFMERKPVNSWVWKEKAANLDSFLN